jgi:hypothetical protein
MVHRRVLARAKSVATRGAPLAVVATIAIGVDDVPVFV